MLAALNAAVSLTGVIFPSLMGMISGHYTQGPVPVQVQNAYTLLINPPSFRAVAH